MKQSAAIQLEIIPDSRINSTGMVVCIINVVCNLVCVYLHHPSKKPFHIFIL